MSALKGLIFDLDGVIADTVPAHFAAWARMFAEEGFAFDQEIYHEKVDGRRRLDGAGAVMQGAEPARVAAAALRKDAYFLEQIEAGRFSIFDDARRFISVCHAAGIDMATASSSRNARYILEKAGIAHFFLSIVGGDDIQNGKPHPEIFLTAAGRMGLNLSSCIVFEDAVSGISAAKSGGFACVGIDRCNQAARLRGADLIIKDFSDLCLDDLQMLLKPNA